MLYYKLLQSCITVLYYSLVSKMIKAFNKIGNLSSKISISQTVTNMGVAVSTLVFITTVIQKFGAM